MGVLSVHAPMMGEKRKLTRDVPNFCIRNRTMRTIADIDSTRAATPKPKILNMKNITENSLKIHYIMLWCNSEEKLMTSTET